MRTIIFSMVLAAVAAVSCEKAQTYADYNVVPLPQRIEYTEGEPFELGGKTVISYPEGNEALEKSAALLAGYINDFTGSQPVIKADGTGKTTIRLESGLPGGNGDAFEVTVSQKTVTVKGTGDAGTFHGIQMFRKSIPAFSEGKTVVFPAARVSGSPRFGYRGAMLDVARHMFPVDFIKRYIDILALHNINYFHWHLSDDQGWRIEIKKYPELAEKGSIRKETLTGSLYDEPHIFDGTPYGGYYTQEEIKEIVKYAAERFITVIPEIDMPGHMLAALTVYPDLGCTGGPYEVATKWGVFPDVLCAGNEKTYEFLEGVFGEIIELFPSKYIHIGGDECPKIRWEVCQKCQAKIRELGLKDKGHLTAETQLQGYVTSRVEKFLNGHGREIIGWDEILEGGHISPEAIIMSWRGTEGGIAAAKSRHKAIMAPHYNLYFDYFQGKDKAVEPLMTGIYLPVEKVYDYDPVPAELSPEQAGYIIGPQANLWTEYIATPAHVEYMLLPRMAALSEIQWVEPEAKDYDSFLARMAGMFDIYSRYGYNFATHIK